MVLGLQVDNSIGNRELDNRGLKGRYATIQFPKSEKGKGYYTTTFLKANTQRLNSTCLVLLVDVWVRVCVVASCELSLLMG